MTTILPNRRWFRFHLRSLLIAIALACAPLAWIAKERRQSWRELELVGEILQYEDNESVMDKSQYSYFDFGGPYDSWELRVANKPQGWARDMASLVLGERVRRASIANSRVETGKTLTTFKSLESLSLYCDITDLTPLAKLHDLRELKIESTNLADLKPLAELQKLKMVSLLGSGVCDILPLAKIPGLRELWVRKTLVTKWDIEEAKHAMPNCVIDHDPFP